MSWYVWYILGCPLGFGIMFHAVRKTTGFKKEPVAAIESLIAGTTFWPLTIILAILFTWVLAP